MTVSIENSFLTEKALDYAKLSSLAYAEWSNGVLVKDQPNYDYYLKLWQDLSSASKGYSVVDYYPNDSSGYSCTIFKHTDPDTGAVKYILANRGTDGINDALADDEIFAGVPPYEQIAAMRNFITSAIAVQYLPASQFDVTGHSLGGCLAQIAKAIYGNAIDEVYTYNAPGAANFYPSADGSKVYNIIGKDWLKTIANWKPDIGGEVFINGGWHWIASVISNLETNKYYIDSRQLIPVIGSKANELFDARYSSGHYTSAPQKITIVGGYGNDTIYGGDGGNLIYGDLPDGFADPNNESGNTSGVAGNDVIFGGGGNDVIYAGGGFNSLNDESGHDTYKLVSSGIDTIGDSDGKGSVYLNNVQLIGGKKIRECVYTNGGNTYIWSGIEGTPLIINRSKIISNFHNEKKDLGIYLYEDKDDDGGSGSGGWDGGVGAAGGVTIPCDPLLIDLNGDGIQTTSLTSGTFFDYDGNGFAERMGWASSDDGSELFSNYTPLNNGGTATNGYAALKQEDTNKDGVVNNLDANWNNLNIWKDLNADGISQSEELFTLEDVGISSINLTATAANITDAGGNTQTLSGTFTKTDGTIGEIADYNLQSDPTYSIPAAWVTIPEDIAALPDLQGYGNVYKLRQKLKYQNTWRRFSEEENMRRAA